MKKDKKTKEMKDVQTDTEIKAENKKTKKNVKSSETSAKDTKKKPDLKKKLGPNLDFASTEAYNLLRTNVLFSFPEGPGAKVIGVTSPCPQEGKSFTILNLAYSTAEAGHKVVLVDCDLRRPSIYKNLGMPLSPGLTNLLVNDQRDVIHAGVLHENMCVITAGDIPPNPSELLGSQRMFEVLGMLKEKFDYIFLDLPPVLSVSDPLVITKNLDGIIVVTRHNTTRRSDVNETVRQLKFTHVHILGFVYNSYGNTGRGYYYRNKYYRKGGYYKNYYKGYYKRHYYSSYKTHHSDSSSANAEQK